jgi:hypothetical protein
MKLKEFLEKFLPDYDGKYKVIKEEVANNLEMDLNSGLVRVLTLSGMQRYFPEALQNFADKICEKQNQCCADFIAERLDDHETEPFEGGIYVDASDVLCYVEQAKIDEL